MCSSDLILTQERPAGWLWARVAGDALDLASLGSAMTASDAQRGKLLAATAAVAGVTALDVLCAQKMTDGVGVTAALSGEISTIRTVTINKSPEELYAFWRDFTNLPRFMQSLQSVEMLGERRSHWTLNMPGGKSVEWDAETTEDQPNRRIAWRSGEGSDVRHRGAVEFRPAAGGRGTVVRVELEYTAPGGAAGAALAKLFGKEPGQQVSSELRHFKQLMETGEITKSDASIHAGMHAAQPSAAGAAA